MSWVDVTPYLDQMASVEISGMLRIELPFDIDVDAPAWIYLLPGISNPISYVLSQMKFDEGVKQALERGKDILVQNGFNVLGYDYRVDSVDLKWNLFYVTGIRGRITCIYIVSAPPKGYRYGHPIAFAALIPLIEIVAWAIAAVLITYFVYKAVAAWREPETRYYMALESAIEACRENPNLPLCGNITITPPSGGWAPWIAVATIAGATGLGIYAYLRYREQKKR